jgi:ADP-heptose:LPS heptosyltransferase
MVNAPDTIAIALQCEGIGDCLFAIPVIRKLHEKYGETARFALFTHRPELFTRCPYVAEAHPFRDCQAYLKGLPNPRLIRLFESSKFPHHLMDTFDFISFPAGIGALSFREKQLEYFPVEMDQSHHFDAVLNTSVTWPSRSWPVENWQAVADHLLASGLSVAVVGRDVASRSDNMVKTSPGLRGCTNLINRLSLDQTYYTIRNCDLFISCQNGLSVLAGATDTEIIVLDMSIEWSKRAIYRHEDPHYKIAYVRGGCDIYCCESYKCPVFDEFRCVPTVAQVLGTGSR